MLFYNLAQSYK